MGFWDKAKKTLDEATYTQNYSKEEAKEIAEEIHGNASALNLRRKRGRKAVIDYLDVGETPKYFFTGTDFDIDDNDEGSQTGLLITDHKIVIVANSITAKSSEYIVLLRDVIGVSVQRRFLSNIRIQTAGHSYKISASGGSPEDVDGAVEYIRKRKAEIDSGDVPKQNPDPINKLERLADLKERGAISEQEFEQKKTTLIDQI